MSIEKKYPRELIDKLKEYYLNNPVNLRDLSRMSEEIVGVFVPYENIHNFTQKEKWAILKGNNGKLISEVSGQEKIQRIADKIYEMLIDEEDPLPKGQVAQLAKTWLEMNVKVNLSGAASSKTSAQSVKDLIAQQQAKEKE